MKLKTRLYLLAAIPVLVLGVVLTCISAQELALSVFDTNYAGMQATATTMRDLFGSIDTTEENEASETALSSMDYIKEQTGFDITYFHGDTRFLTTIRDGNGNRQSGTKASDIVINTVLGQGKDYKDDNIDILGTRYIGYYVPVYGDDSSTPTGMTFLGIPYKNVTNRILSNIRFIILPAIILLILAFVYAWKVGSKVTNDIHQGIQYVGLLEQGKLGFSIDRKLLRRSDIIGDMCRSIASLNERLTKVVTDIQQQCRTLNDSSIIAKQTANDLNDSFTQISAAVEEVAATTTSQAEDASDVNENIQSMGELIEHISSESNTAMSAMTELVAEMKQVEDSVSAISKQTDQTCSSVDKIDSAAELISSISLQTRLLSLNASIEAARAGSHGKGFAVVAAEIQQLAYGSEESTKEIHDILEELKHNSEQSLSGAGEVMNTVSDLREKLHKTEEVFTVLLQEIGLENDSQQSAHFERTSLHSERVKTVSSVHDLSAASEEIAASMEQTAASLESVTSMSETMSEQAESLQEISDTLSEHLEYFSIAASQDSLY